MANESDVEFEIAHVLLIDVVGYSKLLVDTQIEVLKQLNHIVRQTACFRAAEAQGKLMRLPTGDGMALIFSDSPESPVRCAIEISQALRENPTVQLRMGAHSGPVKQVNDVNDRENFAGTGINIAQRVLDCGDGGHILLSQRMAEDLSPYRHWNSTLHDLGVCEVKHGLQLHLFNLCTDGVGNPAVPSKVRQQHRISYRSGNVWRRWTATPLRRGFAFLSAGALAAALVAAFFFLTPPQKSVAVLPFETRSQDPNDADFAYGLNNEVRHCLGSVKGLSVINSISTSQFADPTKRDLRQIAPALHVTHILQGSVQRFSDGVLVWVWLTDMQENKQVWDKEYRLEVAGASVTAANIARDILWHISLRFSAATIEQQPETSKEAKDKYNQAKKLLDASVLSQQPKEDLLEAVRLLNQATVDDPTYAPAYYELAHAHDQLYWRQFARTPESLSAAKAAIDALARLQPNSGELHLARAKHFYWGYLNYAKARTELDLADKAQPPITNDPMAALIAGYINRREGNWIAARQNLEQAYALDPLNPVILQQIAVTDFNERRYAEADAALADAAAILPRDEDLPVSRAAIQLHWKGDTKPMHAALRTLEEKSPTAPRAEDRLFLGLCERDRKAAFAAIHSLGEGDCGQESLPLSRAWCEGVTARAFGEEQTARAAFAQARQDAQQLVAKDPKNTGAICALGLTLAALGEKDAAIAAGLHATDLLPVTRDAIDGALMAEELALIYALVGEKELACKQLDYLISIPSGISYGSLKLYPYWDPLRGYPHFEEILARLAPK